MPRPTFGPRVRPEVPISSAVEIARSLLTRLRAAVAPSDLEVPKGASCTPFKPLDLVTIWKRKEPPYPAARRGICAERGRPVQDPTRGAT